MSSAPDVSESMSKNFEAVSSGMHSKMMTGIEKDNQTMNQLTESELKEKIEAESLAWYYLAQEKLKIKMPEINFSYNLTGKATGEACARIVNRSVIECRIRYNIPLAMDNQDYILNQTVPHEVAHLIAAYYLERGHKRYWKAIMRMFGKPANRCHHLDFSKTKRKVTLTRYLYICPACSYKYYVTSKSHNRLQKAQAMNPAYCTCSACKNHIPVHFVDVVKIVK